MPEQLQHWDMSVFVAMAADSPLHDPEKAVETARANIKKVQTKVWAGATHSLPMELSEAIDAEILDFISKAESAPKP